jgi:hypothetical protein
VDSADAWGLCSLGFEPHWSCFFSKNEICWWFFRGDSVSAYWILKISVCNDWCVNLIIFTEKFSTTLRSFLKFKYAGTIKYSLSTDSSLKFKSFRPLCWFLDLIFFRNLRVELQSVIFLFAKFYDETMAWTKPSVSSRHLFFLLSFSQLFFFSFRVYFFFK